MNEPRPPLPENPSRLLDRLRECMREKHLAYTTEKTYIYWIRNFIRFHHKRHPMRMGAAEVDQYLSWLGVQRQVSPSTQTIALNALVFMYRHLLQLDLGDLNFTRARPRQRIPVVLSHNEALQIISLASGLPKLAMSLMYGSGLRNAECLALRIKDIDFEQNEIVVRAGKGDKDRRTILPASLIPQLHEQVEKVRNLHASGYWQINVVRSKEPRICNQATALLHSLNALTLRSR